MKRLVSVVLVAAAITLAYAATPGDVIALEPRIRVVRHAEGAPGSGAVALENRGAVPFTVGSITANCGPAPAPRLAGGLGSQPFTVFANGTHAITVECPAGLPAGLQRCTFNVRDASGDPVAAFDGACLTERSAELAADASELALGSVAVGAESVPQAFTLDTTGAALHLQLDNDNFVFGAPCQNTTACDLAAGVAGSLLIDVICRPVTAGVHTGSVFAIGADGNALADPIRVTCTGTAAAQAVLAATPQALALGSVEVIDDAADGTITLTNAGAGTSLAVRELSIFDLGVPGAGADWSFELGDACPLPCTLAAGQTLPVAVTFDPRAVQSRPAKLVVTYDAGSATAQVAIDLAGRGTGATLELASTERTLEFGTLGVGMPGTRTLAVQNTGTRATTARLSISQPGTAFTAPATILVPPGGSVPVTVTCQASSPTVASATLTIDASPDAGSGPLELVLACTIADTLLRSDPPVLAFGEIVTDGEPVALELSLTRAAPGPALPYTTAVDPFDARLALAGETAGSTPGTVTVTLEPSSPGTLEVDLVASTTAGGGQSLVVPVRGAVVSLDAEVPALVSLGTFCVGQPTTPSTIELVSIGDGHLGLDVPALAPADAAFEVEALAPAAFPARLAPGGRAQVMATPARRSTSGINTATLTWPTQLGDRTTELTATFVDDGGAIAPDRLSFAPVPIRFAANNAQQVTLQNCSASDLELEPLVVPAPFELDGAFPLVLAPAQRATFGVAFHPTQIGSFERTLEVVTRAGDHFEVALVGEGIGDPNTDDDDADRIGSTSFYACTCTSGSPGGALAIGFALVWALRRRRPRAT